jgi:hypothetical protein
LRWLKFRIHASCCFKNYRRWISRRESWRNNDMRIWRMKINNCGINIYKIIKIFIVMCRKYKCRILV